MRSTRQRTAVADVLGRVDGFRSAQELHDLLRHDGASVGLTTVYRHLQALADAGQVDVLRTDDGEAVYRRCPTDEHHHHLVCRSLRAQRRGRGPGGRDLGGRGRRRSTASPTSATPSRSSAPAPRAPVADDAPTGTCSSAAAAAAAAQRKHRRTDHEGQLDDLREASAAGGGTRVLVADCLDRCDDSNVVLLRPSRAAKRAGAKPLWLGGVLTQAQTDLLVRLAAPRRPGARRPRPGRCSGLRLRPGAPVTAQAWAAFQLLSSSPCRPNISACSSGSPWS